MSVQPGILRAGDDDGSIDPTGVADRRQETPMRILTPAFVAVLVVVLAACGGTAAGSGGTASATSPEPAASVEPEASTEPESSTEPEASTDAGTGGAPQGIAAKPCDLLTQAEVEAAAATGPTTTTAVPGMTADMMSLCGYRSADGEVVVSVGLGEANKANLTTMLFIADSGATDVHRIDGIGDQAAYADEGTLMFTKGDTTVVISVQRSPTASDAAAKKAIVLDLANKALARL